MVWETFIHIAIIVGLFLFKKRLVPLQWLALLITMVGGFWFAYERKAEKKKKEQISAEEASHVDNESGLVMDD